MREPAPSSLASVQESVRKASESPSSPQRKGALRAPLDDTSVPRAQIPATDVCVASEHRRLQGRADALGVSKVSDARFDPEKRKWTFARVSRTRLMPHRNAAHVCMICGRRRYAGGGLAPAHL